MFTEMFIGGTADPDVFAECLDEYAPSSADDYNFNFLESTSEAPSTAP